MLLLKKNWPEACLLIVLAATVPLMFFEIRHLWERPHLQFFPLAWCAFAYLIWKNRDLQWTSDLRRSWGVFVLSTAGAIAFGVASWKGSPWAAHAACILCLSVWGLLRFPAVPVPRWLAWTTLLWITLPLPLGYDTLLVQKLQSISSESAGALLDLIGTPHLRLGNLIEIRAKKLFVDEACSGVDSLYSLAAVSLLIVILQKRPFVVAALAMLLVPAWAWFGNVLRLFLIVLLLDNFGWDLSEGTAHSALGLIVFAVSAACALATIQSLALAFTRFSSSALPRENRAWHIAYNNVVCWPGKPPQVVSEDEQFFGERNPQPKVRNAAKAVESLKTADQWQFFGMTFAKISFVVVVLSVGAGILSAGRIRTSTGVAVVLTQPHYEETSVDAAFGPTSLPPKLLEAQFKGFGKEHRSSDNFFGEYSRIWQYRSGDSNCLFSLDFPFRGFHGLWVCYTSSGHTISGKPKIERTKIPDLAEDWPVTVVELKNELGEISYLWFSMFDSDGRPVSWDDTDPALTERLMTRLLDSETTATPEDPIAFQFQLFVETGDQLNTADKQKFIELYKAALPYAMQEVKKFVSNK